jgi:hypothetical protein
MNKYLQELLKLAKTVIIPGLGALTITNDKTGDIFFMSYLKHDDGKLAEFIASKEGIELIDAKNNLAKYVREIIALLDKGESFDIFNFGKFNKDASGEIVFEQSTKIEHKLSESTFSIDVNEKLAAQLEKATEIDSEKTQIKEQPSLDTILNEKIDLPVADEYADEKIIEKEPLKSDVNVNQEIVSTQIESNTNTELIEDKAVTLDLAEPLEDTIEDKQELTSSETSQIVEEEITEIKSVSTIKDVPEEKIENVKPEKLTTDKNQDNNKSTPTVDKNKKVNSSETASSENLVEEKNKAKYSELKNSKEDSTEKEIIETIPLTPKKNANKKRIIGILIPMIIASFAFLYPKFFNSPNKVKEKASLVEHEEKQDNSQQLEDSSQNTPSEEVKVEETFQATNTVPQPVTPPITPAPVTTTKTQPVYQQPVTSNVQKTNIATQIQVIVGSFTQKENALKFNQTLIQKGYTNGTIIENGGVILLSLGSFPTVQEAANFARTLKLPTGYWLKATK